MVPLGKGKFHGHLLKTEEDAEAICTALGIQPGGRWGFFEKSAPSEKRPDPLEEWATAEASFDPAARDVACPTNGDAGGATSVGSASFPASGLRPPRRWEIAERGRFCPGNAATFSGGKAMNLEGKMIF